MTNSLPLSAGRWPIFPFTRRAWISAMVGIVLLGALLALSLGGGVQAIGTVQVEGDNLEVDAPFSDVVAEIRVRNGSRVEAGEVLVVLAGKQIREELATVEAQLYELWARQDRLDAIRKDMVTVEFRPELMELAAREPEVQQLLEDERQLFVTLRGYVEETIDGLKREKQGLSAQLVALDEQIPLVQEDLRAQEQLLSSGAGARAKLREPLTQIAALRGDRGATEAEIGSIESEQSKTRSAFINDAATEMRELESRVIDLEGRRDTLLRKVAELEIRAPATGGVIDLTVNTVPSVVAPDPDRPLLSIVPEENKLIVVAEVDPRKIGSILLGQQAKLRFTKINSNHTPERLGEVTYVAEDVSEDPRTGFEYYQVHIALDLPYGSAIEGERLAKGMPVEVFFIIEDERPAFQMVKRSTDFLYRAFTEY